MVTNQALFFAEKMHCLWFNTPQDSLPSSQNERDHPRRSLKQTYKDSRRVAVTATEAFPLDLAIREALGQGC